MNFLSYTTSATLTLELTKNDHLSIFVKYFTDIKQYIFGDLNDSSACASCGTIKIFCFIYSNVIDGNLILWSSVILALNQKKKFHLFILDIMLKGLIDFLRLDRKSSE